MRRNYYVYILVNRSRTLYVVVTKDLVRRLRNTARVSRGASRVAMRVYRVVHVEWTSDIEAALAREKQVKRWSRAKKIALIESQNPNWVDLSESWTR